MLYDILIQNTRELHQAMRIYDKIKFTKKKKQQITHEPETRTDGEAQKFYIFKRKIKIG